MCTDWTGESNHQAAAEYVNHASQHRIQSASVAANHTSGQGTTPQAIVTHLLAFHVTAQRYNYGEHKCTQSETIPVVHILLLPILIWNLPITI